MIVKLKRGSNLQLTCVGKDSGGVVVPLDGTWSVAATARSFKGLPIEEHNLNPVIVGGQVEIDKDTVLFSAREYKWDIKFTDAASVRHYTVTGRLVLEEPQTSPTTS